jgi:hypothetical protein
MLKLPGKLQSVVWVVVFSLAVCTTYSLLYLAKSAGVSFFLLINRGMTQFYISSDLFSNTFASFLWGGFLLAILVFLCYGIWTLKLRLRTWLAAVSIFALLALWVCLTILSVVTPLSLIALTAIVSLAAFKILVKLAPNFSLIKNYLLCVLMVAFFVEFLTLIIYNVPTALNFSPQTSVNFSLLNMTELSLSNVAYPFLWLTYLLLASLAIIAFVCKSLPTKTMSKTNGAMRGKSISRIIEKFDRVCRSQSELKVSHRILAVALLFSIVFSFLFVVFTILPSTNPTNMLVSVDGPRYYEMINHMRSGDLNYAFSYAFSNDRTTFLLLGYGLSFLIGTVNVVQLASALLISAFCVVCFLVTGFFVGIPYARVFGVLMVPFSFQALGLIYAGYYANMSALIFVFLYFFVLIKMGQRLSIVGVLSLFCLSILILFSHSWTWFIFALSLIGFLILERSASDRMINLRLSTALIGGCIGVGIVIDLARRFLFSTSSTGSVFATVSSSLGFPNPVYLFSGLKDTVNFTLGGVFANQLLVLLTLAGFVVLLKHNSGISRLLLSWIVVACLPIFFASSSFVFDRSLFLIPSAILASLGLSIAVGFFSYDYRGTGKSVRIRTLLIVLGFVFVTLLNFVIRYLYNINII